MTEIDVHAHLAPVNPPGMAGLAGVEWNAETETLLLDGHRIGIKDLFHVERLLARMDRQGVRRALISIPPPLYRQQLTADGALHWSRYVNSEMRAIAANSAGRLGALFHIPLEHPQLVETLVKDYESAGDYEGVALAAGGHVSIVYSDARYDPLWAWLQGRGAFVFIHPGTCTDPRLAPFYMENLVGNPVETGVAASHLVMAGVPARYPAIRFCLAHAGGIFSSLVGRMQRGFETRRPGVNLEVELPLQAARRFSVDCIAHDAGMLEQARRIFGEDHVLYGSDWPFPMGLGDA